MKIAVVGSGYVGLVTGPCLAEKGNDVVCADVDASKIERLSKGHVPIYEPGLEEIVREQTSRGHLRFTTDVEGAIRDSEVTFITVGTPPKPGGGADLTYVENVADLFADVIASDGKVRVLVTKSTVPPGTTLSLRERIRKRADNDAFGIANNPEFLKEGAAVTDFRKPDRVVLGIDNLVVKRMLVDLYEPFVRSGGKIIVTDPTSSEFGKYASNVMLASRITLMNQLALVAGSVGADIDEVRDIVGSDKRIGPTFLYPGPGYGGSCFGKDVEALRYLAKQKGADLSILDAVDSFNNHHRLWPVRKLEQQLGTDMSPRKIAVWGAAFKPKTDDVRESPAIYVVEALLKNGALVNVYDPEKKTYEHLAAELNARPWIDGLKEKSAMGKWPTYHDKLLESVVSADALLILTDWDEFKSPDFQKMRSTMKIPLIIDARNLYRLDLMKKEGFRYISLGRKQVDAII